MRERERERERESVCVCVCVRACTRVHVCVHAPFSEVYACMYMLETGETETGWDKDSQSHRNTD